MDNLALMRTMRRCLKICLLHRLQSQTAKGIASLRYLVTVVAGDGGIAGGKAIDRLGGGNLSPSHSYSGGMALKVWKS